MRARRSFTSNDKWQNRRAAAVPSRMRVNFHSAERKVIEIMSYSGAHCGVSTRRMKNQFQRGTAPALGDHSPQIRFRVRVENTDYVDRFCVGGSRFPTHLLRALKDALSFVSIHPRNYALCVFKIGTMHGHTIPYRCEESAADVPIIRRANSRWLGRSKHLVRPQSKPGVAVSTPP